MAMGCWPSRSECSWASRWETSEKRSLAPNCIRASDSASKRPGHHRIARFIAVQRTIVSGRFREEVLDVSKKALAQLNVTPRGGYFERRTNGWNRPKAVIDCTRPELRHTSASTSRPGGSLLISKHVRNLPLRGRLRMAGRQFAPCESQFAPATPSGSRADTRR